MSYGKAIIVFATILVGVSTAAAKDSLKLGVTPSLATGIAYVAKHEGIFDKHGLDVELITGNGSVLVSGVVSKSMDLALPTITNFLQAVDSGLPLSIVSGGCLDVKADSRVSLKNGTDLKTPADFVGKTVGVNSIGATLYVEFVHWLITAGIDPAKVNFVEVGFAAMADVLRKGTVDAVVTPEPFGSRITSSGAGIPGPDFTKTWPDALPILLFVATNDWIAKNADVIKRFKAALDETNALIKSDPEKAKSASNTFLKMPDTVLASLTFPPMSTVVDPKGIDTWIEIMGSTGLLKRKLAAKDLIK
jgi:NitT/TauT family transport system substrate-binding protein